MNRMKTRSRLAPPLLVTLAALLSMHPAPAEAQAWGVQRNRFGEVIQRVVRMPMDQELQRRARGLGLNVMNVMWEDTGRYQGSSIGPNISDVTLQVREHVDGGVRTHLLPVIRYPNFSDRTADVPADSVWVKVGNQRRGGQLEAVPLTEVLAHLRSYLSDPSSVRGNGNLLAERDTHFLVSAQHVFVPLPRRGQVEFNPVIFNYQSAPGSPAVLAIVITRQGMSATVVENRPGDQSLQGWGQQLFFNNHGQRTALTAERRSTVQQRIQSGHATAQDEGALEEGADMMLIVQVPLMHRNRGYLSGGGGMEMEDAPAAASAPAPTRRRRSHRSSARPRSDVERAVIGHGEEMGPFYEGGGLRLVRDERFPIRVTVQFYRATSNGVISAQDLADVKAQIDRVYADGDFVGSLVVPESERTRPTDWVRTRRLRRHPDNRCGHRRGGRCRGSESAPSGSSALGPYVTGFLQGITVPFGPILGN
ncbi:MAG: hypothetical protein GXP55_26305 [Deltaproteobacteria bacterium]|nr:hypothetical protein [Deltaproteobacteria bacterium]